MPPKKSMPPPASPAPTPAPTPVKIGLIRKVPGTPSEDVSTPIFSHSMMNALEDMVTQEGIGEVVEGVEIELIDEDEVVPDDPPVSRQCTKRSLFSNPKPSTSKAPELERLQLLTGGGGPRSKNPIWAFFITDDIEIPDPSGVGMILQKGARCQVQLVPGNPRLCNKRILQTEATTSGLLSHLKSQHPSKFAIFKKEKLRLEHEATGSKRAIDAVLDELEGLATPPSKRHRTETGSISGVKPIMKTPFTSSRPSILRHEIQGRVQKKFDLWVTELWVRLGLPWSLLDHPAYKDFWRKVDGK